MRKRVMTCLILTAITAVCCVSMLIAPTLAHIKNSVSWQSTLNLSAKAALDIDVMSPTGQTVILNEMPDQRTIAVNMSSTRGEVSGSLVCNSGEYLTASFDQSHVRITNDPQTVNLTLTKTEACSGLSENKTEHVRITWMPDDSQNQPFWADISVPITPTVQEEQTEQNTVSNTTVSTTELITKWTTAFSKEMPLILTVNPPADCNEVALLCNEMFPPMTRYTVNGETTVLYDGGSILLYPTDTAEIIVRVDMPDSALTSVGSHSVIARARIGDQIREQQVTATFVEQEPYAEPANTLILKKDAVLDIPVQMDWQGCSGEITLFRLDADENGELEWVQLEQGTSGITVQANEENNMQLALDNTAFPPAGTYRISIAWKYGDADVVCKDIVFFIQYDRPVSY